MDWQCALQRLEGAYAPATLRSYRSDIQAYVQWCADTGCAPFPCSKSRLQDFLLSQAAGDISVSTIRRRLYALRKLHHLLELEYPGESEDVRLTLRRIRRGTHDRPAQARGLTAVHLKQFLDLQPDSPMGLRNRAMLSLGYDILTRRSELVALRDEDISYHENGTLKVLIRRSKTDPFGAGRLAFTSRRTGQLVSDWLSWRGAGHDWLFCPIYKGKAVKRHLSATTVRRVIQTTAQQAGYDQQGTSRFSGHSLRVGAAQDLLCQGHDTVAIMRAGGWKSLSVLARYLEQAAHNVWEDT